MIALEDSTVRLSRNELYAHHTENGEDLLILVGDYQSVTNEGHYILCDAFLDLAQQLGVSRIYTLGGYAT